MFVSTAIAWEDCRNWQMAENEFIAAEKVGYLDIQISHGQYYFTLEWYFLLQILKLTIQFWDSTMSEKLTETKDEDVNKQDYLSKRMELGACRARVVCMGRTHEISNSLVS